MLGVEGVPDITRSVAMIVGMTHLSVGHEHHGCRYSHFNKHTPSGKSFKIAAEQVELLFRNQDQIRVPENAGIGEGRWLDPVAQHFEKMVNARFENPVVLVRISTTKQWAAKERVEGLVFSEAARVNETLGPENGEGFIVAWNPAIRALIKSGRCA